MRYEPIKANIIRIGNSQGVRLPKILLTMSGIQRAVEIQVINGAIIIRPAQLPQTSRNGWDSSFQSMASSDDDLLLDANTPTEWDSEEWEWK